MRLRPVTGSDRDFVESVHFDTQRWAIEALFGWCGDEVERATFAEFYDARNTREEDLHLASMYLQAEQQHKGIGTELLERFIREADANHISLRLSTARVHPARRLYERLGLTAIHEDDSKVYLQRKPR